MTSEENPDPFAMLSIPILRISQQCPIPLRCCRQQKVLPNKTKYENEELTQREQVTEIIQYGFPAVLLTTVRLILG